LYFNVIAGNIVNNVCNEIEMLVITGTMPEKCQACCCHSWWNKCSFI